MPLLTLAEAGDRLGLSPSRLRHLIAEGRLKASLVGKTWTVTAREVERFAAIPRHPGRRPKVSPESVRVERT